MGKRLAPETKSTLHCKDSDRKADVPAVHTMEEGEPVSQWGRRLRGALMMGLVWAAVWAPAAVLLGLVLDPDGSADEPWPLIGAFPGFLAASEEGLRPTLVEEGNDLSHVSSPASRDTHSVRRICPRAAMTSGQSLRLEGALEHQIEFA